MNVYDGAPGSTVPSTIRLVTRNPEFGVMVKDLLDPPVTLTAPDGEMEPPVPADAVMVQEDAPLWVMV